MTSWRDTASAQAQADLDGLLEPALGFAQQSLGERGEFYPYAVVVNIAGEQEMIMAEAPTEQPESTSVIDSITRDLASHRDNYRAVAVVADVRVREAGTDAIRVTLEHREGPVMSVVLPYTRRKFRGGYVFGELQGATAGPSVW
ncbi:MAG TPA: hypothetical protein VIM08_04180 [Arthrobacter sp.]|jgi:hypothetical protein